MQSYFRIYRKDFINNLIEKGIVSNKTKIGTIMPVLSEHLIPHFIRGYFDGDGCIGIYPYQSKRNYNVICYICSNTNSILDVFYKYLKSKNIDCFITISKERIYYLKIRNKSIIDFWDIIKPKNDVNASLQRKLKKFEFYRNYKEQSLLAN